MAALTARIVTKKTGVPTSRRLPVFEQAVLETHPEPGRSAPKPCPHEGSNIGELRFSLLHLKYASVA
jgi:hypothetical protein